VSENSAYYLVRDWTNVSDVKVQRPVDMVVFGDEIIQVIDQAKEEGRKISVYALGELLLDWS
jgi:hypothetical protein